MDNLKKFTFKGKFLMLALDHRGSFKKYIRPEDPTKVTDSEAIKVKRAIIAATAKEFSGVLIDPVWGLPAYEFKKPYLLCLEATGYVENKGERNTKLEYTAKQLKKWGATGAKLLLYFNPAAKNCAAQIAVAARALNDAHKNGLPLFLEIVTYGNEELKKSRGEWVIKSLEALINKGVVPDVWKLEYPGDGRYCAQITKLVGKVPWILLTRGETFTVFAKQLRIAIKNGVTGFLAGRALWQEIGKCKTELARKKYLTGVVRKRFQKINKITVN